MKRVENNPAQSARRLEENHNNPEHQTWVSLHIRTRRSKSVNPDVKKDENNSSTEHNTVDRGDVEETLQSGVQVVDNTSFRNTRHEVRAQKTP